jgi:hypothetical protein
MTWTHDFTTSVEIEDGLHVVAVPPRVSLSAGPGYHPVVGTVNDVGFHAALAPLPGGAHRLHLPGELRDRTGLGAGDSATIVLQPDPSGAVPEVPDDLAAALDALIGARRSFDRLPSVETREMIAWVDSAARQVDRVRRITRVLVRVVDGE